MIDLKTEATPANAQGVHLDGASYNSNDGFSPGQSIVVRVPGLDTPEALAATGPVSLTALGEYADENAPVVVIDKKTGERWPIWVEIDSNATSPTSETAVLIHPAKNFASGHRYVVAMRDLKNGAGDTLGAPEGFRYYRDKLPSDEAAINDQRPRMNGDFQALREAGVERSDLYLAWDFTVASDENIAGYTLAMRDDAFAQLGDTNLADNVVQGTAPDFTVDSVENYTVGQDADMARRVAGHVRGPLLHEAELRSGRHAEPERRRRAGPERDLDGQLQLHDPAHRGGRSRRQPGPRVRLRPRPAGQRQRGDVLAAEDARQHLQHHGLRDERDRHVRGGRAEHDRDPRQHEQVPAARRPPAAGSAQRPLPRPPAEQRRRLRHRSRLPGRRHADRSTARTRPSSTPRACTTTATARARSSAAR